MTTWPEPDTLFAQLPIFNHAIDAYSGATQLAVMMETGNISQPISLLSRLLGLQTGSLGESPILLLLGGCTAKAPSMIRIAP